MNIFEKEMYDFYTVPENFKTALEVSNYLPAIRKQVLEEFWQEVKAKVSSLLTETLPGNMVRIDTPDNIFYQYSQIGIFNPSLNPNQGSEAPFWACFQELSGRLYLGIWIDPTDTKWNIEEIKRKLSVLPSVQKSPSDSDWWVTLKSMDYLFSDLKTIEMILPANRQGLVNEFSKLLVDLAAEIEDKIDLGKLLAETMVKG